MTRFKIVNNSRHKDAPIAEMEELIGVQLFHVGNHWTGAHHVSALLETQGFYLQLVDDLPEAPGALGYHSIDSNGLPFSKVAVNPSLQNGSDWLTGKYSVVSVLGHEAIETNGDPIVNIERDIDGSRTTPQELCDAVEDAGYSHKGADLTNFLFPSWFDPFGKAPFDYLGQLEAPFTMTAGGYMIITQNGKTSQVFGDEMPAWRRAYHIQKGTRTGR